MDHERIDIPDELISPSDALLQATEQIGLYWWFWNAIERKLSCSPQLEEMLGLKGENLDPFDPSFYKNIHPDDGRDNLDRVRRLISGDENLYEIEFRLKDHNGEWQWFYNRGTVLSRDENGEGIVVGGITMNMSWKYKSLLTRAEENERLYHTLFEAADDAIGLFSMNREMLLINPAFHELFGYDREEFFELGWMEIIHPEDRMEIAAHSEELARNGSLSIDYRVKRKSGEYLCVSSKSVLIPVEGEGPDLVMTIIRDITERREAMRELELAKEKAEESDKLKSAFLANMSHEIRTPMNSIVGFSNLLVNPGLDEAARAMYVQRIVRNSELLLALISDIIDLAKIESNQLILVYGKQKLSVLVSEMKKYAENEINRLNKNEIEIITDESESDCEIEIDVNRITQVMKNLVNNAVKFTDAGEVRIGCRMSDSEPNVILFVEDSGVGISSDNYDLIFNQFRQVDDSNTRKFGGTGLGLAICKNLVEMMGGKIWVESTEGKGSLFQVELPRKAVLVQHAEASQTPYKTRETNQESKHRILVVDDEKDSLELFHEILYGLGHDVATAGSGVEALQVLEEGPLPDLVFMDDRMPVLSGTETMRIIKDRYPAVRVIAQSAHALVGDGPGFLKEGFDGYLPKPFSPDQLHEILSLLQSA